MLDNFIHSAMALAKACKQKTPSSGDIPSTTHTTGCDNGCSVLMAIFETSVKLSQDLTQSITSQKGIGAFKTDDEASFYPIDLISERNFFLALSCFSPPPLECIRLCANKIKDIKDKHGKMILDYISDLTTCWNKFFCQTKKILDNSRSVFVSQNHLEAALDLTHKLVLTCATSGLSTTADIKKRIRQFYDSLPDLASDFCKYYADISTTGTRHNDDSHSRTETSRHQYTIPISVVKSTINQSTKEIKAHVTAETDRGIASPKNKRVRKFGHEGNGLKGPKTKMMEKQRKIFFDYLKKYPETIDHSRIRRAHECWLKNPKWDEASKASGEAKGYASYKSLAQAS